MTLLFYVLTFYQTDSIQQATDSIPVKSIMFQSESKSDLKNYRYQHTQGFFCDFEDRINQNRKVKLNIGVGEQ